MRGHRALIAMRRRGVRPSCVWISLDGDATRSWRDWHIHSPTFADVEIDADESPALLDLRWVIGLTAFVWGLDAPRVAAVAQACRDHDAARVITAAGDPRRPADEMHITDTRKARSWLS